MVDGWRLAVDGRTCGGAANHVLRLACQVGTPAVFDAYGWPHDLSDEEILARLVALNAERAEEERRGIVRWLRPEFQNPSGTAASSQTAIVLAETAPAAEPAARELPE